MEKTPEIIALCDAVEQKAGGVLQSPAGFDKLADKVKDTTKESLSPSTLKRIFGYSKCKYEKMQKSTLDILSRYADFKNWDDFCENLGKTHDDSSDKVNSKTLISNDLNTGDRLRLTWLPDRIVTAKYLGNLKFVVEKSLNSKLEVGTTFECLQFIIGEPAFFDIIMPDGTKKTYKAAQKGGITSCDKI